MTEREGEGGGVGREGADEEFVAGGVAEGEGGAGAEGLREREEHLAVGGVGVEGEEERGGLVDGDLAGLEDGGEGGVLGDEDGAGVVGDAVVPVGEEEGGVGAVGEDGGGVALEVDAVAGGDAEGAVGGEGDGVEAAGSEEGGEGGVLGDEYGAGVVGVAVVPVGEFEAVAWNGGDGLGGGVGVEGGVESGALCGVVGGDLHEPLVVGDDAEGSEMLSPCPAVISFPWTIRTIELTCTGIHHFLV